MTTTERYAIQSMAMDLKRVSSGVHSGSYQMAARFLAEAQKRKKEIKGLYPEYIITILKQIDNLELKKESSAEEAMMYSILLQNFSLT